MKTVLLLIAATAILAGCMTDEPISTTPPDYGVLPADYQTTITNYFNSTLKDPYSAHYKFLTPLKASWYQGWSSHVYYGWHVLVFVNAKNGYGGYTGDQTYVFTFASGILYEVLSPGDPWPMPP